MTTLLRRSRPRPAGILATALLVAAGTILAGWSGLADRTASPVGDAASGPQPANGGVQPLAVPVPIPGAGTASLPTGSLTQLDHNIDAWSKNVEANPLDFISATNLGTLYQARARLTADLADHMRALEAARIAISIAPTQPGARLLEASVLFSLHEFAGALDAADRLYREDPGQLGALATRADAELELGDLDAARRDLESLAVTIGGPARAYIGGPALDIRLARLAAVGGDLAGALDLALRARDAATLAGEEPGFYEFAAGEYARLAGDVDAARAGFEAALRIRDDDLGALLGLARVQAFSGEIEAAIGTLEAVVAIVPTPEAEALLGDLLALRAADPARSKADRATDARAAEVAHGTVRLTRTLSEVAGSVFDRQLILFDLDHGAATDATLDAARAAFLVRPDATGRDVVAWALHRLGRDGEAWAESQAVLSTGAADARTLFHAGAIAAAMGDRRAALGLLARALALGPALDPIERIEAQALLAEVAVGPPAPG